MLALPKSTLISDGRDQSAAKACLYQARTGCSASRCAGEFAVNVLSVDSAMIRIEQRMVPIWDCRKTDRGYGSQLGAAAGPILQGLDMAALLAPLQRGHVEAL